MATEFAPEHIDHYLNFIRNLGYSESTERAYASDLRQIFSDPKKEIKLGENDNFWLFRSRKWLKENAELSTATRARKVATLKSFFHFLHQQGITETDLSFRLTTPKVARKLPHYLSGDEALAILKNKNCFKDEANGEQRLTLFLLLYGGGLRVSEACFLRWGDIQLEKRSARIIGKGGLERIVIFPDSVVDILGRTLQGIGDEAFIWGEQSLGTRTAYNWIRDIGVRAGLERPLHPHMLRHSFATHILQSGGNLRAIQELLGHRSLSATERYTHLGLSDLARTLEKFHPLERKN